MVDVTILVRVLWPGGPQRIAINDADLLRQEGLDVDLVFIRDTQRKVEKFDSFPHKVIFNSHSSKRPLQKIFYMITKHYNPGRGNDATIDLDLIAKYELSKNDSKVVIYFDQFTALFSILRKIRKPFKKIVFIHETAFREKSPLKKLIERIALFDSDYIITNSYFNKKILIDKGYKKIEVVYPGINKELEILGFDKRSNICIIVTVFEPWRRPELLLNIASHLKYTKIVMAGQWADDHYKMKIEEEVKTRHLSEKIFITGLLEENALQELYRTAKVALRFGFDEHGPGMGSLEAIGYGIPLVVNSGIGITELLKKYEYDLIVEDLSPCKIAEIIDRLSSDISYWETHHNTIMQIAKANSWDKHGEILSNVIKRVMSESA
jgi:glycosyltransferase involved in cell wall biosynthesis